MKFLKKIPAPLKLWRTRKRKNNVKKKKTKIFKPRSSKYIVLTFKTLISLFVFIFLISSLIYFLTSDFFKISDISCEKERLPCLDKERNFFLDLAGQNIFLLNSNKIIRSIKINYPQIEKIKIEKKLPNKVLIKITERKKFASLTFDKKSWFIIDSYGFVLQKTDKKPEVLPEIFFKKDKPNLRNNQKLDQKEIISSLLVLKLMKDNFILLEKLVIDSQNLITLFLADDVVASLSASKEIDFQVDSLQFILRQSKIEGDLPSFIDLRFNKPVVKY